MTAACGTYSGWARHKSQREAPCDPCVQAQRDYHRAHRALGRKKRPSATMTCDCCAMEFTSADHRGRYCSQLCFLFTRNGPLSSSVPATHPSRIADLVELWRSQRGPLRAAYEDGDSGTFFAALVLKADTSASDCWIWNNLRDGYPYLRVGRKEVPLHRAVLEMKHGAKLGSQHAHHMCANTACVNPDHLQPVTHRENVAEMLARQSYLARIRELEAALRDLDPDHQLLHVVAVA